MNYVSALELRALECALEELRHLRRRHRHVDLHGSRFRHPLRRGGRLVAGRLDTQLEIRKKVPLRSACIDGEVEAIGCVGARLALRRGIAELIGSTRDRVVKNPTDMRRVTAL